MWHLCQNKKDLKAIHPFGKPKHYPTSFPCLVEFEEVDAGIAGSQWTGLWKPIPKGLDVALLDQLLSTRPTVLKVY